MYQIESIKLKHFDGLWLNKIESFEMSISDAVTVILGRNGCGKSRLISMLSPLAPTRFDLLPGGHKIQVVRLDNTQYELKSVNKNDSIKNTLTNLTTGEVLIENGNNSVFNKQVKHLFKYDKDLHDLLTGRVKLTTMSVGERKKWFSMLSESDLTYALSFFKKTKEHHRDLTGSIKSLKYNIGALRPRVLESEAEREAMQGRLHALQQDITMLDREIDRVQANPDVAEVHLERVESHLAQINKEVLKLDICIPKSLQRLSTRELESELASHEAHYQQSLERLSDVQGRISKAVQVNNIDVDGLKQYCIDIDAAIETLNRDLGPLVFPAMVTANTGDLQHAHNSVSEYIETLSVALHDMAVDIPTDNLRKRFEEAQARTGELTGQVTRLDRQDQSLTAQLKAYHETCDITCVNCNHSFKPGVRQQDIAIIQAQSQDISEALRDAKMQLAEQTKVVEQYGKLLHTSDSINNVGRYFKNCAPVMFLFRELGKRNAFTQQPLSHLPLLQRYQDELAQAVERRRLEERKERINDEIALATATQTEDVETLQRIEVELNERITHHLSVRSVIRQQLQLFRDVELRQRRLNELDVEHQKALAEHERLSNLVIGNIKQELLSSHRQQLWDLLIVTRQRFDEMERERLRLEDQEQQLDTQTVRLAAVKQIMDAMSPDTGILAKYLYQCIEKITNLMTEYVEQIWGYAMQVLPCDVSDADMDYKFPYWSGDSSRPKADISLGSVGQKEVFDFVFVLAVYRALGLERYPLFLDELGSGFDQGHRASMIDFVKGLHGGGFCSQVFMVSHDPASHFKLANAANVVIDQEGITLPQVFNEHVKIIYA